MTALRFDIRRHRERGLPDETVGDRQGDRLLRQEGFSGMAIYLRGL